MARGYPYTSVALGVHPSQVKDEIKRLKRHGINAEFNKDGSMEINSKGMGRAITKACGMINKDDNCGGESRHDEE